MSMRNFQEENKYFDLILFCKLTKYLLSFNFRYLMF